MWRSFFLLVALLAIFPAAVRAAQGTAVVIDVSGEINQYSSDMLTQHLAQAKQLGASTAIIQLDTYGGAVTAGLEMSSLLKRQHNLHTIAYVPEKALSAGTMIALACDEIIMGPSARIGDAAPITINQQGSLEPLPPTERAKFASPVLDDFRDSARRNGYEPLLVESMVALGRGVWWIEDEAGQREFVTEWPRPAISDSHTWKLVTGVQQPIVKSDELLTVSTDRAIQLGLAKGISADSTALANQRGLTIAATFAPATGEKFLALFQTPGVRFVLFVVFIMSLYIALHAPGHGAAEASAVLSLGLMIGVPMLTGYAQWWEIVLIFIGLGLLAAEIFVIPGHGLAGVPGLGLMLFGFLMTFVPKEPSGLPGFLPSMKTTWQALEGGLTVIVGGMICSLFLAAWLRKYLPALPYFHRLVLSSSPGTGDDFPLQSWPMVGDFGTATTDLRPGGSAQFVDRAVGDRRLFNVVCDSGYVPAGTEVTVLEVGGGRVIVRPV